MHYSLDGWAVFQQPRQKETLLLKCIKCFRVVDLIFEGLDINCRSADTGSNFAEELSRF